MLTVRDETILRILKRSRQIAMEIDSEFETEYMDMSIDTLAFRLKHLALRYNCCMVSSTTSEGGTAKVYCAKVYNKLDVSTFRNAAANSEPLAIIVGFKWLADRGYFNEQSL